MYMVLFFTITLAVSVLAMILLLTIKRYELSTGRVVFAGIRPRVGTFFERLSRLSRNILPALVRQYLERMMRLVLVTLQLWIAKVILTLEHLLERVLTAVREKTGEVHITREPSAFLREVADYKKNLSYSKEESEDQQ